MSTPRTSSLPVGTDQLSLFPEPTASEIEDNLVEESIDDRNDDTLTTWLSDPGALETSQADDDREPGEAAQELTGNLLYELTVVQKMDYQAAWEIAKKEWAFLPDEEDQPQLSFDPATLSPNQALPTISA